MLTRTLPIDASIVFNLCHGTIDLTSCYDDGSSCWEVGVPPIRFEQLAPMSVIKGHGGIAFAVCMAGYDAVDATGNRLSHSTTDYTCLAETSNAQAPTCSTPDEGAAVVKKAYAEYPDSAIAQHAAGTTSIDLTIDAQGNVAGTNVYGTSGNAALDRAALDAANASLFAPGVRQCNAIPSHYLFRVTFNA
jgi:TonB family protein